MTALGQDSTAPGIAISPRGVLLTLSGVILLLGVLHVAVYLCWYNDTCGPARGAIFSLGYLFDLVAESNVPTWYSSIQLAAVALALAVAGGAEAHRARWRGLAILFAYLSLDEATDLHGLWIGVLRGAHIGGVHEGFNWIVPGAALVAAIAALYLPWVLRLPRRTRATFVLAGALYVGGGLVLEGVGAFIADENFANVSYILVSTAEEMLEMLGVAVMLYGVLVHLRGRDLAVRVLA